MQVVAVVTLKQVKEKVSKGPQPGPPPLRQGSVGVAVEVFRMLGGMLVGVPAGVPAGVLSGVVLARLASAPVDVSAQTEARRVASAARRKMMFFMFAVKNVLI